MSPSLAEGCTESCPAAAGLAARSTGGSAGSQGTAWTEAIAAGPCPWDGNWGLWRSSFNLALTIIAALQPGGLGLCDAAVVQYGGFASLSAAPSPVHGSHLQRGLELRSGGENHFLPKQTSCQLTLWFKNKGCSLRSLGPLSSPLCAPLALSASPPDCLSNSPRSIAGWFCVSNLIMWFWTIKCKPFSATGNVLSNNPVDSA